MAQHVKQVESFLLSAPRGADGEVAQFRAFIGRVPTLKYHIKFSGLFALHIRSEPVGFHHPATERRGLLLVLTGEIVLAESTTKVLEDGKGFAFGM